MSSTTSGRGQLKSRLTEQVQWMLMEPNRYIRWITGVTLRPYQKAPLKRITESIQQHLGDTIILVFPRQSGKDELLVHLKEYLLHLYAPLPVGIVEVNPTYKPQTTAALMRFEQALTQNRLIRKRWKKRGATMRLLDKAHVAFLSGDKTASTRGASASLLLIVNEAQDVQPSVYGQVLEPMTASTNATRVLAGTVWTSDTLLSREIRAARQAEKSDGRKRVFMVDATQVSKSVEWYGRHVEAAIQKYGRQHPFVKTQYFNEEIDAKAGMFNAAHRALMTGDRPAAGKPEDGKIYAFLLDVAGQAEANMSRAREADASRDEGRDAVTLRIVEIDLSTLETLRLPTYRGVYLQQWTGQNHLTVFGQLKALAEAWKPQHIVMDATGVGEGLWALLDRAFPTRVIPVKFTQSLKSELGYGFLAIINTGRFRDCCPTTMAAVGAQHAAPRAATFPSRSQIDREYAACECELLVGPQKTMRWGVPEGRRDEEGRAIHDDIPITDSLTVLLDRLKWHERFEPFMVRAKDPLEEMRGFQIYDLGSTIGTGDDQRRFAGQIAERESHEPSTGRAKANAMYLWLPPPPLRGTSPQCLDRAPVDSGRVDTFGGEYTGAAAGSLYDLSRVAAHTFVTPVLVISVLTKITEWVYYPALGASHEEHRSSPPYQP